MNLKDLGRRIRDRREKCRLKQSDVAHALQISAQAVSKWERGENAPDIAVLMDLTRVLGVTTDWLLSGGEPGRDTFMATVYCSDLTGYARKSESVPPRELAFWINGVFHLITEAVLLNEGVPVKYIGDGFLAFFSGPRHADRALRAARQAKISAPHDGLGVMLHSGEIYLGAIGHREYARPDIMGEAVNTAFLALGWLSAKSPGGVGLTEAARQALQEKTPNGKPHLARIRGLSAPLKIHEVGKA